MVEPSAGLQAKMLIQKQNLSMSLTKRAAENERAVANLIDQVAEQGKVTASRGNTVNTSA